VSIDREWCVYTGLWHRPNEMTDDHVLPLSLGGHDRFTIRASKRGNSHVNRTLDENMKAHPLLANIRRLKGLHGHRPTRPVIRWASKVGDQDTYLNLSEPQIHIESFRSQGTHALNMRQAVQGLSEFPVRFDFDLNLLLRFGCRLALGTSYHLFGDAFREYGYHEELRSLMDSDNVWRDLRFRLANKRGPGFWALGWPHSLGPQSNHYGVLSAPAHGVISSSRNTLSSKSFLAFLFSAGCFVGTLMWQRIAISSRTGGTSKSARS
jgi:hypothetical protein